MIPEVFPVFTVDDILEPPSEEYEIGEKRSTVGWLKHLFLYHYLDKNKKLLVIRSEDRKDYKKALDKFRSVNIIKKEDLHKWEDRVSRKQQAAALNKLRKSMGYTNEFYL